MAGHESPGPEVLDSLFTHGVALPDNFVLHGRSGARGRMGRPGDMIIVLRVHIQESIASEHAGPFFISFFHLFSVFFWGLGFVFLFEVGSWTGVLALLELL